MQEPFTEPERFTTMVALPTASPKAQKLVAAFNRAVAEKLVAFHLSPTELGVATEAAGIWTEKPYRLTVTGPRAQEVTCKCPAAKRGLECKHRAVAVFCRRRGAYAVRPAVKEVAPAAAFTPDQAAIIAAGVAPSLAGCYA